MIGDAVDALVGYLRNVQQSVLAWKHADDCAEIEKLQYGAVIDAADFHFRRDFLDAALGCFATFGGYAGNGYRTVVIDVDGSPGFFGDCADDRPTFADYIADLFGLDLDGDHARRVGRQFRARRGQRLAHDTEDMHAAFLGLLQCDIHNLLGDALDLDVHLQCGDPVLGTGNLEIHVTQMILVPENIRQHRKSVAFLDQAHGDTGDMRLQRHACVHQREAAPADGSHRARTVGFGDF